jgi:hypothetical protein
MMLLVLIAAATLAPTALWSALAGTAVVPALTAVLTQLTAPAWLKAIANLLLSAVAGVLSSALSGGILDVAHWEQILLAIAVAWVTSVASYYGLYRPTGASDRIARATARFGIGAG